jgi:hypothetical protein
MSRIAHGKEIQVRKRKEKKPVLTSPWKIGMFVSLQLLLVSLWVGYFLVTQYQVDLKWLTYGLGGMNVDWALFLQRMYPLALSVVLVSLASYFLIASTVRRYKYYLDSGQDYRKMIALAESIDDLTNPAQIARLSSYPELQAVLRNYGDQIREISQELGNDESAVDLDDLESTVCGVLRGESVSGKDLAAKGYASLCRKIRDHVESERTRLEEIERRGEDDRKIIRRAALAYGRVTEALGGAGEDLLEITKSVHDLGMIATEMRDGRRATAESSHAGGEESYRTIIGEMESSIRKLADGGQVLHEFSEENNGIAINLALMAARGSVDEHDLATFAERVRSTAERFHKLSGTVSSIAQGLLGTCYAFKERMGAKAPAERGATGELPSRIAAIAGAIEERGTALERQICSVGSELHEVQELLQTGVDHTAEAAKAYHEATVAEAQQKHLEPQSSEPPRGSGAAEEAKRQQESSEFVIDHGSSWEGMAERERTEEKDRKTEQSPSYDETEVSKVVERVSREAASEARASDFSDMSSLRELDNPPPAAGTGKTSEPDSVPRDDDSEGMLKRRWLKIDIERTEQEEETGRVQVMIEAPTEKPRGEVKVEAPEEPRGEVKVEAPEKSQPEVTVEAPDQRAAAEPEAAGGERPGAGAAVAEEGERLGAEEEDRIFDLFELGAVEYHERTDARS